MESSVAFKSIGFSAALILNKLRSEGRISDARAANDRERQADDEQEEKTRAGLENLSAGVGRPGSKRPTS